MKTAQEVIDYLAQVSNYYKYLAMDEDGEWFAFTQRPSIGLCAWHGGKAILPLKNIQPATDWKQSLTEVKL